MNVLHISAECYPAAKAGGLGDVAGALPKYLNKAGLNASVIIPKYQTKWIVAQSFDVVYSGSIRIHHQYYPFTIERLKSDTLGFPFFVANIPGKFDRPGIYADSNGGNYEDDVERWISFQQAALQWAQQLEEQPDVLHCHDHHTGLVPFMVKHCYEYQGLKDTPTIFTIHNGVYHGSFSWDQMYLLPFFDINARGLLDWGSAINPLATAIKCCWRLTTVSPSYMEELRNRSNGLEGLLRSEQAKSVGILNGIDLQVWNPATDPYLEHQLEEDLASYKAANKAALCERFGLDPDLPLITFIGRLVGEKGADLIPDAVYQFFNYGHKAAFIILGTGEPYLHYRFNQMREQLPSFNASLEYNEGLAHQLYAGADFLLMPSRVEPCGLNQMYALRYGTVPIVRSVGGLIDSIVDVDQGEEGSGIRFDGFSVEEAVWALYRAVQLYGDKERFEEIQQHILTVDFSWERSAKTYESIYASLQRPVTTAEVEEEEQ